MLTVSTRMWRTPIRSFQFRSAEVIFSMLEAMSIAVFPKKAAGNCSPQAGGMPVCLPVE